MTAPATRKAERQPARDKSPGTLASELVALVITYVRQETIVPIKALGRFIAFGIAGAVLIAIGGTMFTIATVRAIQAETGTHLRGSLTWVPYVGGILFSGGAALLAASRIRRSPR